jgi:hypothetical protein
MRENEREEHKGEGGREGWGGWKRKKGKGRLERGKLIK